MNNHQIICEIITDFNVKNHLFLWKFPHYKSSRTYYNNNIVNKTNIDTGKIAEILNKFLELKSLKDRCTTKVPELPAFCAELNGEIENEENLFKKNKLLKEKLQKYFKSPDFEQNKIELINYIVKTWGGIQGLKNYRTIEKDIASAKQVDMNISGRNTCIPSRSKVLSFLNPEEYVICDSRVIFSLNWLLFITRIKTRTEEQFVQFSKLEPRNKTCEIYSLSYLLEKYNLQPAEEKTQYNDFIKVIEDLTVKLKEKLKEKQGDDWKIYCTEMLLFQIADDLEYGIPCLVRELLLNKDAVNNFSYEDAIELLKSKK